MSSFWQIGEHKQNSLHTTLLTDVVLDARVNALVVYEVLLGEEGFAAINARVWTRPVFVSLFVRLEGVLRGETFRAYCTRVRSRARVYVVVLLQ